MPARDVRTTLVDHAQGVDGPHEGTGPDRWPDREDSRTEKPPIRFGDHDGGGREEEQASQPIGSVALLLLVSLFWKTLRLKARLLGARR